jgi:hypothetical protein
MLVGRGTYLGVLFILCDVEAKVVRFVDDARHVVGLAHVVEDVVGLEGEMSGEPGVGVVDCR